MASYINVDTAISEAKRLQREKAKILEQLAIVRTDLRNAVTTKATSAEQTKWIEEQFPIRERETDPAVRLAREEAKVVELRKKVEKVGTAA